MANYSPQPAAEALPFLQASLKAITGPSVANFRRLAQNPNASLGQGLLWVVIAAAISSLLSGVLFTFFPATSYQFKTLIDMFGQNTDLPTDFFARQVPTLANLATTLICGIPMAIVGAVLATLISAGLYHLIAKLLGGGGEYGKLVYMLALVQAPISIVTGLITPIPYLGCLSFLIAIYGFILYTLAIESVHLFGVGKAVLTLIIPTIVICLFVICLVVGVIAIFGAAISEIYQQYPGGTLPLP
jgi:hypothetical protein